MRILLAAPVDGHSQLYISRALTRAGHVPELFDYRLYAAMKGTDEMNDIFVARKRAADLVLVLKGELIRATNLEHTLLWNFDSWYAKDASLLEAAKHAKLFLTPSAGLVPFYREEGVNAHYLPEAADLEAHLSLKEHMTEGQRFRFGSDVSFVGTVDSVQGRDEWLSGVGETGRRQGLPDTQYSLKIWGSYPGKLSMYWHTMQRADGDAAHNCVVSASKIILDRTRTPSIEGAISARVYRTMAAGGFVLMKRQANLFNYIPPRTVGVYENDSDTTREVGHFLTNDEERALTARKGYEWVAVHGTWDVRIQELLKLI